MEQPDPNAPDDASQYRHARRYAPERRRDRTAHDPDPRTPTQHDRDRILYSSAFRRLAGITQVASPTELQPVHNRLTHSLKVAQVGRNLAATLLTQIADHELIEAAGGLDPDVVEAASLAHDLGHPPFGHVAETALDELLLEHDPASGGFNGNAQSFRIITYLAVRYPEERGLNLTRATLNAVLKYPWLRHAKPGLRREKWGAYDTEESTFSWCRRQTPLLHDGRTLEATLMDWADDITYAVHDVEDFFRAGLIPLDRFATDPRESQRFLDAAMGTTGATGAEAELLVNAFGSSGVGVLGLPGPFTGRREDRAALRSWTSRLIGRYVNSSAWLNVRPGGRLFLAIDPQLQAEVRILKELTWHYVIGSPALVAQRYGQRQLIRGLFETFTNASTSARDRIIFPEFHRDELERAGSDDRAVKRIVADLISGMSESQAVAVHCRLTGQSLGSAMDAYLS